MSLAARWPEREGYLRGTPAPSYTCIHTHSAGNYLMSHRTCSCVQRVPGTLWVRPAGPRLLLSEPLLKLRLKRMWYFQIWEMWLWSIKIPHWDKPPPLPGGQIKTFSLSMTFFFFFGVGGKQFFSLNGEEKTITYESMVNHIRSSLNPG